MGAETLYRIRDSLSFFEFIYVLIISLNAALWIKGWNLINTSNVLVPHFINIALDICFPTELHHRRLGYWNIGITIYDFVILMIEFANVAGELDSALIGTDIDRTDTRSFRLVSLVLLFAASLTRVAIWFVATKYRNSTGIQRNTRIAVVSSHNGQDEKIVTAGPVGIGSQAKRTTSVFRSLQPSPEEPS